MSVGQTASARCYPKTHTPNLIGGAEDDIELQRRASVHDRLGVKLAQLRERATLAEEAGVEKVRGLALGLELEECLSPLREIAELEHPVRHRELDELSLVGQQRRCCRCCCWFLALFRAPFLIREM